MNSRYCPICNCNKVVKIGKQNKLQRYKCKSCGKTWSSQHRKQRLLSEHIWQDFSGDYAVVRVLAKRYNKSQSTIRRILHEYKLPDIIQLPRPLVLTMDATYFSRTGGELIVIDPNHQSGQNELVYCQHLNGTERTRDYEIAIDSLTSAGYTIQGVTIDGRRGVREMLTKKAIPVQHCQFHQLLTITQCLTKHPKLPANIELRAIALTLPRTNRITLTDQLDSWYQKYGVWLKERYNDPTTGKMRYKHTKTRRAYFSLMRNLPYLFTCQDYPELHIPNTCNKLDGKFGTIKSYMKVHRGYSKSLKTKLLYSFFSGATEE